MSEIDVIRILSFFAIYIFFGVIVAYSLNGEWDDLLIFVIIFYPIIIALLIIFGFFYFASFVGKKINDFIEEKFPNIF